MYILRLVKPFPQMIHFSVCNCVNAWISYFYSFFHCYLCLNNMFGYSMSASHRVPVHWICFFVGRFCLFIFFWPLTVFTKYGREWNREKVQEKNPELKMNWMKRTQETNEPLTLKWNGMNRLRVPLLFAHFPHKEFAFEKLAMNNIDQILKIRLVRPTRRCTKPSTNGQSFLFVYVSVKYLVGVIMNSTLILV